jgi:uncharacterized protein
VGPAPRQVQGTTKLLVRNTTRESILANAADIADTSARRRKGLLAQEVLLPGQGLWIVPCQGVHTWMMRFPIDVLYLDRRKRVKKVRSTMRAWRLSFCLTAHSVLELPAGTIERTLTQPGDQLQFDSN